MQININTENLLSPKPLREIWQKSSLKIERKAWEDYAKALEEFERSYTRD